MVESRQAVTIRFPIPLLAKARNLKSDRESFNDFVIEAVDREVRRRQGLEAYTEILRLREDIAAAVGIQPDSTAMIRELRDGYGRDE